LKQLLFLLLLLPSFCFAQDTLSITKYSNGKDKKLVKERIMGFSTPRFYFIGGDVTEINDSKMGYATSIYVDSVKVDTTVWVSLERLTSVIYCSSNNPKTIQKRKDRYNKSQWGLMPSVLAFGAFPVLLITGEKKAAIISVAAAAVYYVIYHAVTHATEYDLLMKWKVNVPSAN